MFELNPAFQGSSSHCTKPVFFKLCMDKVMSMHNKKRIKTCYEWSRKGIEEKKKKSIQYIMCCPWFFALILSILNQQVLEQMGGVNQ